MISLFILGFSLFALAKFGVAQWRALWVSVATQRVSESLQLSTGIDGAAIGPGDFDALKGFCERLSPELKQTSSWLKEVSAYYHMVSLIEKLPALSVWANREMQLCSRYAAVVLDQNLAMSLDRQMAGRSIQPTLKYKRRSDFFGGVRSRCRGRDRRCAPKRKQ